MKRFKIIVEHAMVVFSEKVFEAETLEEAIEQAESEPWEEDNGWQLRAFLDAHSRCELREELCSVVFDVGEELAKDTETKNA